jgi:hypothetical protein
MTKRPTPSGHEPIPQSETAPQQTDPAATSLRSELMASSSIIHTLGRGSHGKSFWARWAIGRAQNAGRDLIIADFDRMNQTLRACYGDQRCVIPASAEEADVENCLRQIAEQLMEQPRNALIDVGAGDFTLNRLSLKLGGAVDFFEENGVLPVAVHFIGPHLDDLAYLRELEPQPGASDPVERKGLFAPKRTILVLNEALVPKGHAIEHFFKPVTDHPVFRAAVARGAQPVFMPRLEDARVVELKNLDFIAAERGEPGQDGTRLGPFNRSFIQRWRQLMETNHAAVLEWLP